MGEEKKLTGEQLATIYKLADDLQHGCLHGPIPTKTTMQLVIDVFALKAHITALEGERDAAQTELSKAARLINCAGPLDHRVQVLKEDYSRQLTALQVERDELVQRLREATQ